MNCPERYCGTELELFAEAQRWKAYLRHEIAPFVGGRVLEVGAGIGATTAALAALPRQSWTCLEPDARLAEDLLRRTDLPPVDCRVGTLDGLDDPSFDTILYIDVLEHIADDAAELRQAAARLAPGGHLVVLSPAHPMLFSAFDAAIGHHRRYVRASLTAAAAPELRLVRLVHLDSVGMLASLANRWLLRKDKPSTADVAVWDRLMVPLSRLLDPLLGHRLGRSILAVWQAAR